MPLTDLRKEYTQARLSKADALPNPLAFFQLWFEQALQAKLAEPNAMTLATVSPQGLPSARIVLIKGVEEDSFVFFTNYESRKGQELDANPNAALLFHWVELERQVRIEGVVERLPAAQSDEYYQSRPLGSRLGAWASPQSQVIENREVLDHSLANVTAEKGDHPPRPPFWGGYRLVPRYIEFWQGRASRLHDRLAYQREGNKWNLVRLAP